MKEVSQPSPIFKPLKEDSDYLIYNDGRLYSKKANRFLKGKIDNVGYQVYALAIINPLIEGRRKSKMLYAHRLVAEYFLENPDNLPYVHHKDENKLNNNVNNLAWVNAKTNMEEHNKKRTEIKRDKPRYYENDLEEEEWLPILDDNTYSVSNKGRVKNNKTNRLLKIDEHQKYSRIQLKNRKHYYIHRLVYCTFHNDYSLDDYVIDHIDNNPRNNELSNLQKITSSENSQRQERNQK